MEVEGESVQGLGGGEGYLVLLKRLRPVHRSGCPQVPRRPERDTRPLSHPWRASESGAGGGAGQGSATPNSVAPSGGGLLAVVLFLETRRPRVWSPAFPARSPPSPARLMQQPEHEL